MRRTLALASTAPAEAGSSPGFRLKPSQNPSRANPPDSSKHQLCSSNPAGSENAAGDGSTATGRTWEAVWLGVLQPSQRGGFQTPSCGPQCTLASPGLRQHATLLFHSRQTIRRKTGSKQHQRKPDRREAWRGRSLAEPRGGLVNWRTCSGFKFCNLWLKLHIQTCGNKTSAWKDRPFRAARCGGSALTAGSRC